MKEDKLVSQEEILLQKEYMQKVKSRKGDGTQYAFVDTYGCQQNEADSEILRGMLIEMGYTLTKSEEEADVIVINTCAVREHAEMRVLGNVGQLVHTKDKKPNQIIAICGCMVQQGHMVEKIKKSYHHVNLVFGTHALYRFPELLFRVMTGKKRVFELIDSDGRIFEDMPVYRENSTKAWVSIMYGCNNFCSYCIVPYVRGRERSRRPEMIISEITKLIENGARDVTLLGQNVNSYGKDLDENIDFAELLERINAIPGEFKIRFMTSHPKDATERLFKTMAKCEKVAHHIHLPFQSGSNRILKLMNRGYTREKYAELIKCARTYMPDISFTSDVIVGFPGESNEDFDETISLVEDIGFDALFTFIYSKRKGTPAAEMEDPTTREEKGQRFDRLLKVQSKIAEKYAEELLGKTVRVLIENDEGGDVYNLVARTDTNRPIRLTGCSELVGKFVNAKIEVCSKWSMEGRIVD
ncbi:MAG: tRNA (N6-isopentenyl adenosine(37)-C2)-methylthiotransferase MiaB [Clostridia bacterium]|nr:tRNA (N6-isopentenyl adenosine(37)-C2)-methylthiotransferase MiaB [Clostridia bacterium]